MRLATVVSGMEVAQELRDGIEALIERMDPETAKDVARRLFVEDSEFLRSLVVAAPRLANSAIQFLNILSESIKNMSDEEIGQAVSGVLREIDASEVGKAKNTYWDIIIKIFENNSQLMLETDTGYLLSVLREVDFGKARRAFVAHSGSKISSLGITVDEVFANPVALINVIGALVPVLNDLLNVSGRALGYLNLPPENLTWAIVKVLQDIDSEALGKNIDGLSTLIDALHKGSLIVGRDEPYLKNGLRQVGEKIALNIDQAQMIEAGKALGINLESVLGPDAVMVFGEEKRALIISQLLASVVGLVLKLVSQGIGNLGECSPEALAQLGFTDGFDAEEFGRLINSLLVLFNKLAGNNPKALGQVGQKLIAGIDADELKEAGTVLFGQLTGMFPEEKVREAGSISAVVGGSANMGLASFNKWCSKNPTDIQAAISGAIGTLDSDLVHQAMEHIMRQVAVAMVENVDLLKKILGPVIKGVLKISVGLVKDMANPKKLWAFSPKNIGRLGRSKS